MSKMQEVGNFVSILQNGAFISKKINYDLGYWYSYNILFLLRVDFLPHVTLKLQK